MNSVPLHASIKLFWFVGSVLISMFYNSATLLYCDNHNVTQIPQ